MMLSIFVTLLVAFIGSTHGDLLLIYGEQSKISIRKAATAEVVKEISINKYQRIRIAYHYKQDLIFYTQDKDLYRIHLVDDNGDRKVSGSGELFVDKNADHMEILLSSNKLSGISGLHVDEANNKLYVMEYRKIFQFDLDGKNKRTVYSSPNIMQGLFYHNNMLYFSVESKKWSDQAIVRLDTTTNQLEPLTVATSGSIFSLSVDGVNNKLVYRQGNEVKVIAIDSASSAYPVARPRVVLSDSQYTGGYGLQAIAADSRVLIWLSREQLYAGIVNSAYTFLSKKNIFKYGKKGYSFRPYSLHMFHHKFTVPSKPLPSFYNCINMN